MVDSKYFWALRFFTLHYCYTFYYYNYYLFLSLRARSTPGVLFTCCH